MITLDSGQLHGSRLDPRIFSAAVKERCVSVAETFIRNDARMSHPWCMIMLDLLPEVYICMISLGLCPPSNNRDLSDPDNPGHKSLGTTTEAKSTRVLIIDDDETMREAIGYILEDLDIGFDAVSSGEEGLAKLDEQSYSLVFLDLVLHTGSHGIEIFNRLHERGGNPRVVLMTASGSREPIFEEAARLQRFILRKPFSLDEVEQIINEAKPPDQS